MTERINKSWREQRKPVTATRADGYTVNFQSLWEAADIVARKKGCLHSTARKEIRKAIKDASWRYGNLWSWTKV